MSGEFLEIWFPIMACVASGFEHSVANIYLIPAGMMLGANVPWAQFLSWNLIPVTMGNVVGGLVFVGVPYFFCVKHELSAISLSSIHSPVVLEQQAGYLHSGAVPVVS
jgi:formate/nitrite transporter FocA (FNT family)